MVIPTDNLCIGIVGTGTMGSGIVQVLARSACIETILWYGRTPQSTNASRDEVGARFLNLVKKNRLSPEEQHRFREKIKVVSSIDDLCNCHCIIEAVSEEFDAKRTVFLELAKVCKPETILASNTSSLSITALAALTPYPENVVGLHFFNPAPVMKLAEVIAGLTTAQTSLDWVLSFAALLGKDPVLVNEAPGFIVNRMLIPMVNEAIGILAEDVACAEEIDKAMRLGANHPIGPLALADLIGLDVCLSIMETLHNETGDPKYRAHPLMRKMVRGNRLGRKTGCGFFTY